MKVKMGLEALTMVEDPITRIESILYPLLPLTLLIFSRSLKLSIQQIGLNIVMYQKCEYYVI